MTTEARANVLHVRTAENINTWKSVEGLLRVTGMQKIVSPTGEQFSGVMVHDIPTGARGSDKTAAVITELNLNQKHFLKIGEKVEINNILFEVIS